MKGGGTPGTTRGPRAEPGEDALDWLGVSGRLTSGVGRCRSGGVLGVGAGGRAWSARIG